MVPFWGDDNFLELGSGDDCTKLWIELYHFKIEIFMICELYFNWKKRKAGELMLPYFKT